VGVFVFSYVRAAYRRRGDAVREAEKLVASFGSCGVEMAEGFADDPNVSADRREHFKRVARHARRRHEFLKSPDTASRYLEVGRMTNRS
jgi:hypothetical protein